MISTPKQLKHLLTCGAIFFHRLMDGTLSGSRGHPPIQQILSATLVWNFVSSEAAQRYVFEAFLEPIRPTHSAPSSMDAGWQTQKRVSFYASSILWTVKQLYLVFTARQTTIRDTPWERWCNAAIDQPLAIKRRRSRWLQSKEPTGNPTICHLALSIFAFAVKKENILLHFFQLVT